MKAIILTRGNNAKEQEEKCKSYAQSKGYEVLDVIEYIKDTAIPLSADVVIVSHISRVTRDYLKFLKIEKELKDYNVTIEVARSGV